MAGQFSRHQTTGEGVENLQRPWSDESLELQMVDRILEPQTLAHFLEFLLNGVYPSGKPKLLAPYLEEADMEMLITPLASWAPPPWNTSNKPPLMEYIGECIGSFEDETGLQVLPHSMAAIKARVWEGIAPMSVARWRARGLDKADNHAAAVQHLSQVINIFQNYLGQPEAQDALRAVYNNIYDRLGEFNTPFNEARKALQPEHETFDFAGAWSEYIEDLFDSITQRAHLWVTQRIKEHQEQALAAVKAYSPDSAVHPAPPPADAVQWRLTNQMHDLRELSLRADVSILIPLEGFKGHQARSVLEEGPFSAEMSTLSDRRQDVRLKAAASLMRSLKNPLSIMMDFVADMSDPQMIVDKYNAQSEIQDQIRLKLRSLSHELGLEPWAATAIERLRYHPEEEDGEQEGKWEETTARKWGFVGYRLTHAQTEAEWSHFTEQIKSEALSWAADLPGAQQLDPTFTIHWLDGKDIGVIDDDLEGAAEHFGAYATSDEFERMFGTTGQEADFLVVNGEAWKSYQEMVTGTTAPATLGSAANFVLAVDHNFDPESPGDHAEESPGFTGRMRIIPSVLISDLYALLFAQTQGSRELWPLAMRHPDQIYIGPVTRFDEEQWALQT